MRVYKTLQGDSFDVISLRVYGDEHHMVELINANIEHRKIVLFPAGVEIKVPDIETITNDDPGLPPWAREVKE